jgi:hypothetical protein
MKKIVVGILLLFVMMGCNDTTPEQIEKLRRGMSIEEVKTVLGEPYTKEFRTDGCIMKYSYSDNGYRHALYVYIENNQVTYWY